MQRQMVKDLLDNIDRIPEVVKFKDINEFERMEERFFEVEQIFGDIVGIGLNSVEFCPNQSPPSIQREVLPWLWIIYPESKTEILEFADNDLKQIVTNYSQDVNR